MTPEYIDQLANMADPARLWQRPAREQMELRGIQRIQLDTGVALRRYAEHVRQLERVLAEGRSLLITPLSSNGTAVKTVKTPTSHQQLRDNK